MSRAYDGRCKTGYRVLWCDVIHSLVHSHRRFRNFLITLIKNKTSSILGKDAESSSGTSEYICRTLSVTLHTTLINCREFREVTDTTSYWKKHRTYHRLPTALQSSDINCKYSVLRAMLMKIQVCWVVTQSSGKYLLVIRVIVLPPSSRTKDKTTISGPPKLTWHHSAQFSVNGKRVDKCRGQITRPRKQ